MYTNTKSVLFHFAIDEHYTSVHDLLDDTAFAVLPLNASTVDFKSSNRDVIKRQTFSFNSRGLINVLHSLFINYSHF